MIKEREIEAKALALDKSASELSDNDVGVPQRSQSSVTKEDRVTRR